MKEPKLNREMKPKKVNDSYIVNASSNIRVLNKMMNWDIPIDEAKTINGAVLENLGYWVTLRCAQHPGLPGGDHQCDDAYVRRESDGRLGGRGD